LKNFWDYRRHDLVKCFNCFAPLGGADPKPNDGASGRWSQWCPTCKTSTFYDIRSEVVSHRVAPRKTA
jgi:hypothetical protein